MRWDRRTVLIGLLVLVGLMTVGMAMRGIQHARQLSARSDEPIQPWMTVPYIAHVYHVSPDVIQRALGLPSGPPDRRPLHQIARAQGRPVAVLIAEITAAIRRAHPPPPPPPPSAPASPEPRSVP